MGSDRLMVLWIAMSVELMAPWGSEALDQAVFSLCLARIVKAMHASTTRWRRYVTLLTNIGHDIFDLFCVLFVTLVCC